LISYGGLNQAAHCEEAPKTQCRKCSFFECRGEKNVGAAKKS